MSNYDVHVLTTNDPTYPPLLLEIAHPPARLFLRGSVSALTACPLAVVGTRRVSPYGRQAMRQIIEPVCRAGIGVVSGLAIGIDAIAHRAALAAGVPTVAVVGHGLDITYPREHGALADEILAHGGAIISEFPDGTPPLRQHFPQRNRIIAGLVRAVLLGEAPDKSGALITAKFAVDANRDVLAVPGPIDQPGFVGPHHWIQHGARLVTSAADVLDALDIAIADAPTSHRDDAPDWSPETRQIVEILRHGAAHVDEIVLRSRLDTSLVSACLSLLEVQAIVEHDESMIYSLT